METIIPCPQCYWIYIVKAESAGLGAHLESFGPFAAASEGGYVAFNSLIPCCSEPHQTARGDWEKQKWLPWRYQPLQVWLSHKC